MRIERRKRRFALGIGADWNPARQDNGKYIYFIIGLIWWELIIGQKRP